MIGFVYQHWGLSVFFIDWEQPRTIHDQPKYDSPHTSLRKLYSNRFPRSENKSSRIASDVIASRRKRRLKYPSLLRLKNSRRISLPSARSRDPRCRRQTRSAATCTIFRSAFGELTSSRTSGANCKPEEG